MKTELCKVREKYFFQKQNSSFFLLLFAVLGDEDDYAESLDVNLKNYSLSSIQL